MGDGQTEAVDRESQSSTTTGRPSYVFSEYERKSVRRGWRCLGAGFVLNLSMIAANFLYGHSLLRSVIGISGFLLGCAVFWWFAIRSFLTVRRWVREGRCRHCGYPLRPIGTAPPEDPDRCTECGADDARGPK